MSIKWVVLKFTLRGHLESGNIDHWYNFVDLQGNQGTEEDPESVYHALVDYLRMITHEKYHLESRMKRSSLFVDSQFFSNDITNKEFSIL